MSGLFGGPPMYRGRPPQGAHMSMFIAERIFPIRHELLTQSLTEANIRPELRERWLRHGLGMKPALVEKSGSECEGRYKSEPIIVVKRPE